tara:strand:- start:1783 stop:1941 length:159 start_codon:yes stop_codon:yes gene_type:complete
MDILIAIILLFIVYQLHNLDKTLSSTMVEHKQTGRSFVRVQETNVEEMANTP